MYFWCFVRCNNSSESHRHGWWSCTRGQERSNSPPRSSRGWTSVCCGPVAELVSWSYSRSPHGRCHSPEVKYVKIVWHSPSENQTESKASVVSIWSPSDPRSTAPAAAWGPLEPWGHSVWEWGTAAGDTGPDWTDCSWAASPVLPWLPSTHKTFEGGIHYDFLCLMHVYILRSSSFLLETKLQQKPFDHS